MRKEEVDDDRQQKSILIPLVKVVREFKWNENFAEEKLGFITTSMWWKKFIFYFMLSIGLVMVLIAVVLLLKARQLTNLLKGDGNSAA